MCPDPDLISAYVDGEVPSPWRERFEEHLASCGDCAAVAAGYRALGEGIRGDSADDAAVAAALERGRVRLDSLLEARSQAAAASSAARPAWGRSISLPLPIAAAAALLVVLLGGATTLIALKPSSGRAAIRTVASGEIAPPQAMPASMDELLRYLDSGDGQVTLTINLPTGATFGSAGKPVIMRGGQVVSGSPLGDSSP